MAWHPTYYTLQMNDEDTSTTVMVPTFGGIFTDADVAQNKADYLNEKCNRDGRFYYSVVPVHILAVEEKTHAES